MPPPLLYTLLLHLLHGAALVKWGPKASEMCGWHRGHLLMGAPASPASQVLPHLCQQ